MNTESNGPSIYIATVNIMEEFEPRRISLYKSIQIHIVNYVRKFH